MNSNVIRVRSVRGCREPLGVENCDWRRRGRVVGLRGHGSPGGEGREPEEAQVDEVTATRVACASAA